MRFHQKHWKYDHVRQRKCEQAVMKSRSSVKSDNHKADFHGEGPFRRYRSGAADSALDNWAPDIWAPFPIFFFVL